MKTNICVYFDSALSLCVSKKKISIAISRIIKPYTQLRTVVTH